MQPPRWLEIAAAPLASLFVLVVLYLSAAHSPEESRGVAMEVPQIAWTDVSQIRHADFRCLINDRTILIVLDASGHTAINENPIPDSELASRLALIYENRAEKLAYLIADPTLPYERFVSLYAQISTSSPGLHVALMTPAIQTASQNWRLNATPFLLWRKGAGQPDCSTMLSFPSFNSVRIPVAR